MFKALKRGRDGARVKTFHTETLLIKKNNSNNLRWRKCFLSHVAADFLIKSQSNISLGLFNSINKNEIVSENTTTLFKVSYRKNWSQPPSERKKRLIICDNAWAVPRKTCLLTFFLSSQKNCMHWKVTSNPFLAAAAETSLMKVKLPFVLSCPANYPPLPGSPVFVPVCIEL